MNRYRVTCAFGESHSAFYVTDSQAAEADQPAVVASFRDNRDAAVRLARELNAINWELFDSTWPREVY